MTDKIARYHVFDDVLSGDTSAEPG